jgi:predicted tellurium resistance membrane protein TerC
MDYLLQLATDPTAWDALAAPLMQLALLGTVAMIVRLTEHIPIMIIAVVIAVATMLLAADPLAEFINADPTVVMVALGFLLLIGTTLIADGFGAHLAKGYIYAAMAFSDMIEVLNMLAWRARRRRGETAWIVAPEQFP